MDKRIDGWMKVPKCDRCHFAASVEPNDPKLQLSPLKCDQCDYVVGDGVKKKRALRLKNHMRNKHGDSIPEEGTGRFLSSLCFEEMLRNSLHLYKRRIGNNRPVFGLDDKLTLSSCMIIVFFFWYRVFFHNSLQPLPRQHRCSKLSTQCQCTVTPIGWYFFFVQPIAAEC